MYFILSASSSGIGIVPVDFLFQKYFIPPVAFFAQSFIVRFA